MGCAAGGIALLLIATAAYNGVALFPPAGGSKYSPPRPWNTITIESPEIRIIIAVCLALAGVGLLWLAYKIVRFREDKRL